MAQNLLDVQHLSREFRIGSFLTGRKMLALDDVSLSIGGTPTILSVVGESGCGKTTLAKIVLRLLRPSGGQILLEGQDAFKGVSADGFMHQVQPIFQNPFEAFSSRREVEKYLFDTAIAYGGAKNRKQAVEAADRALKSVGLSYDVVRGKYMTQFSGGELQRVSIARALITSPKLIVADEPVAMIDASMKMNIVNLFRSIRDDYGISFIYITHDLSTAYYVSDYIATLYRGNMIEYGPSIDIMENPAHPYTELLMNSVPHVGDKWKKNIRMSEAETREFSLNYCKFASRCNFATQECRTSRPPNVALDAHRSVLCYHPLIASKV